MHAPLLLLLLSCSSVAVNLFVDPLFGSDAPGFGGSVSSALRSLLAAKAAVRSHLASKDTNASIRVKLLPGRHLVTGGPLLLNERDGGKSHTNQRVVWESYDVSDPAIIDGGTLVGSWSKSTDIEGAFIAPVPSALGVNPTLRQLWVNGKRAERPILYPINLDGRWPGAAGQKPCCPSPCRNREAPYYPCPSCNCSLTNTTHGFDFTAVNWNARHDPTQWKNAGDVEFIFHFPGQWTPWIEPRCTVANITGKLVDLKQPCFGDLAQRNLGPSKGQVR